MTLTITYTSTGFQLVDENGNVYIEKPVVRTDPGDTPSAIEAKIQAAAQAALAAVQS